MPPAYKPPARLYVLIARQTRRAVVFRRGPAKQTLLLTWDLENDRVTPGQWIKGRIQERRGDVSPDGELLLYFVVSGRPPLFSWGAISRPPYLTALAICGTSMLSGGRFGQDWRTLELNDPHFGGFESPTSEPLPAGLSASVGPASRLMDEELTNVRLQRDGWTIVSAGTTRRHSRRSSMSIVVDPPGMRVRAIGAGDLWLRVLFHGHSRNNGPPTVETAQVTDSQDRVVLDLGRIDWIDVDHNGDLLYAARGRLLRQPQKTITMGSAASVVGGPERPAIYRGGDPRLGDPMAVNNGFASPTHRRRGEFATSLLNLGHSLP